MHTCLPAGSALPFTTDNFTAQPTPLPGGEPYVSLAAGDVHVCGLLANGSIVCMGRNDIGQLGTVSPWYYSQQPWTGIPSIVYGGGSYTALSANANATCALMVNGSAQCWVGDRTYPLCAPAPNDMAAALFCSTLHCRAMATTKYAARARVTPNRCRRQ